MTKYINAGKLLAEIERRIESWTIRGKHSPAGQGRDTCDSRVTELSDLLPFITSLQQDEKAVELEMCSQAYWEEQGWIMIPPDVTIEGIDSLLKQVRKKLQQEQPEQICKTCVFYENNCPFIRGKLIPYPNKVCKDYTYSAMKEQEQPSLPSNLDEAAEQWCKTNNKGIAISVDKKSHYLAEGKDAFKAGAEWMAGQFQKIEGDLVDWYSTSDGKDYCCGIKTDEAFEIPEGFYTRKKQ